MDVGDGTCMRCSVVPWRHEANSGDSGGPSGDARWAVQLRRYGRLRGCAPWDVQHHDRLLFLCAAPALSDISPANAAQTGGASVTTLLGLNFASNDPSPSASLELSVECSSTSWTSATGVACLPALFRGGTKRTAVLVAGLVGTHAGQFSYDGTGACAAVRRGTCSVMIACCFAQLRP